MYRKALIIYEQLGSKEGMANQYGNLGIVFKMRGDLDEAEAMYRKALIIYEQLESKEGMANQYGNLGLLHWERDEFNRARQTWTRALDLYLQVGIPDKITLIQSRLDGLP